MEDFVVASNKDGRIEAFYIKNGSTYHTWQKSPSSYTDWTKEYSLVGALPGGSSAVRIEACLNRASGQIHVVVFASNGKYYTTYQSANSAGGWVAWEQITQS